MNIDKIIVPVGIQDKLISKHQVRVDEVRQVLLNLPRIRFAEKVIFRAKMCTLLQGKRLGDAT